MWPETTGPAASVGGGDITRPANPLVDRGLARIPFATAGELAAIVTTVPAMLPVRLAETVRIAADLDLRTTQAETVQIATVAGIPSFGARADVGDGGGDGAGDRSVREQAPGIELGACVVACGAALPDETVPFPAYESAVEALQRGATESALQSQCELLDWMAGTLAMSATDADRPRGATAWVRNSLLREQLEVESRRLRSIARHLEILGSRIAEAEGRRRPPR